ncbi:MAG: hypothetical protein L6R40_004279 [Gallowayella cf. fulva]|nr:MAG: hypothetical protein L6R40_004279 [Xanthomendoza cf. fulva]
MHGGSRSPRISHRALFRRNDSSTLTEATVTCETTWSGWKGVEKIFSFGDSYTDTGFNPTGAQPNDTYPLGNPFSNSSTPPYHTFTNGPNWIEYLTFKYNESQIDTYNLARSGAVVNTTAIGQNETIDLIHQINDRFAPNYVSQNTVGWNASNSLFSLFLGVNDVNRSWKQHNLQINDVVFSSYLQQLETLYQYGARSFLLHNVPPVNRGPYVAESDRATEGNDINDFNYRMKRLFSQFTSGHTDISVLLFNTNKLFSQAMDNPATWAQTANLRNTTGSCKAYESGDVPSMDHSDSSCAYPVNQYFWLNGLHPTYPVHEAIAAQVALALAYNS